jgi:uncharacterized membrane protein YdjX (TVP38/TMEM64 family)
MHGTREHKFACCGKIILLGLAFASVAAIVTAVLLDGGGVLHLHRMLRSVTHGDVTALRGQLRAMGALAVFALMLLILAHTFLPFPAEILAAASGFALGVPLALAVLLAGFTTSALIAYLLGARLGRPVAARLVGARRLAAAERFVERGGWRALLAVRIFPLLPFSPICVACGLARVPLRRYVWTTALGMLPEFALVTYIGSRLGSFSLANPDVWGPLVGIIILTFAGPMVLRKGRTSERVDTDGLEGTGT